MKNARSTVSPLLQVIKRHLKAQKRTYRDLGQALQTSETTIKRWFFSERLTVKQLNDIVDYLGISLVELAQEAEAPPLEQLTLAEEEVLVSDPKLLQILTRVMHRWTLEEILGYYNFSETECIQYLMQLEHMRFIDLMPENRIRLRTSRFFEWLPNGPVIQMIHRALLPELLASPPSAERDLEMFRIFSLAPAMLPKAQSYAQRFFSRLAELEYQSIRLPQSQRSSYSVVLMLRQHEYQLFSGDRRKKRDG